MLTKINWIRCLMIGCSILLFNNLYSQESKTIQTNDLDKITPESLAQAQLDAYNARDIDAFLQPYSDSIEIYTFPDKLMSKGKDRMRLTYGSMFEEMKDLHCTLVNRIVEGNTVIDHERVIFNKDRPPLKAIAIYKIEDGKIAKVYFIQ